MDSLHPKQGAYEAQRAQANRQELVERIARAIRDDGRVELLNGLFLNRSSAPTKPAHGVSTPAFCVIAQGSKELFFGEERYQYDPEHYLLTTVELPVVSQVLEASGEHPYLGVRVRLDPTLVGAVLVEANLPVPPGHGDVKAMDTSRLDASLLDAVVRLVRLVDSATEAQVLAPLVKREIIARIYMENLCILFGSF